MSRRTAGVAAAVALVLGGLGLSGGWSAPAAAAPVGHQVVSHRASPAGPLARPTSTRQSHPAAASALPSAAPYSQAPTFTDTFTVDTQLDPTADTSCATRDGTCSLRAAIAAAEAEPAGSVANVVIPSGYDIVLVEQVSEDPTSSTLDLTRSMVITGNGSTVDGGRHQVFNQYDAPSVEITGLTITNGVTTGDGGGMYVHNGSLVLTGDTFSGNTAADGGGLYTAGDAQLWVDGGKFTGNVATGGLPSAPAGVSVQEDGVYAHGDGGGMYTYGSANIKDTVFGGPNPEDGNMAEEGAGLYNYDGNVSITGSTFENNSSPSTFGYGVALYNDEVMDLSNSKIQNNSAPYGADGVGLDTEYLMTIKDTSFTGNTAGGDNTTYGGAIYDDGDTTTLSDVTVTDNSVAPTNGEFVYGGAVLSYAYNFTWDGGTVSGQTNGGDGQSNFIEGGAVYLDGSHAVVSNLTITGTSNDSLPDNYPEGGAIYVNEYTSLSNVTISDTVNKGYDVYGGAIYNDDYATITDVKITGTDNHATDSSGGYIAGGAIYNDGENFALTSLSVDNTTNLADTGSDVASDNSSEVDGGVLYNDYESTATNVSFTNTTSHAVGGAGRVYGGGVYNDESLIANDFQVVGVDVQADSYVEGGIFYNDDRLQATNFTLGNGSVRVLGGEMAGTPYADGAILYNDSQANLTNATIADITVGVAEIVLPPLATIPFPENYAWGIENDDLLQLTNATIANDTMTGPAEATWLLYGYGSSQASLYNTIVASADPTENCSTGTGTGLILSAGYNLDTGSTCGFKTPPGDLSDVADPMVASLADNGGSVLTAALEATSQATSPAINAGGDANCPPTDARGVTRPQGSHCDIGAFEFEATTPPPNPPPYIGPGGGGAGGGSTVSPTSRLSGPDRIGTAIAVSQQSFANGAAGAVVLVRSDDFPDALAGSPLAVARNAPILLTPTATLDPSVTAEIQRVLPAGGTVYLLGGTSALSAALESQVQALGYSTVRYSGPDRFSTAVAIASSLPSVSRVLLANGTNFPDAVSAAAATGTPGTVIVLSDGSTMPAPTATFLTAHPVATFAIGGPAAAADPAATAVDGTDRYSTAVDVAQQFFTAPTGAGMASGLDFPDALAAGPRLARLGEPLLLTDPASLPSTVAAYLTANKATITHVEIYGGTAAVSSAIEAAVAALLAP